MKQVTYQNKDVTSKFLADHFKGKSFRVYGLDLPDIQEVLPTNIPIVQAKELRIEKYRFYQLSYRRYPVRA